VVEVKKLEIVEVMDQCAKRPAVVGEVEGRRGRISQRKVLM
jgi:hypothetical protein